MSTPLAMQIHALDALIAKDAIGKLRRAGDLSNSQAEQMRQWIADLRNTVVTIKQHETAVRECLRKEMNHG